MGEDVKLLVKLLDDIEATLTVASNDSKNIKSLLNVFHRESVDPVKDNQPTPLNPVIPTIVDRLYQLLDQQRETNHINSKNISRLHELV